MNRFHFVALTAFIVLAVCSGQAMSQISAPLPCEAPPAGSNEQVVQCYEDACEVFQKAYSDCDTAECRKIVKLEYAYALNQCLPILNAPVSRSTHVDRASWITLYYIEGEWSYSFNDVAPAGSAVFRY